MKATRSRRTTSSAPRSLQTDLPLMASCQLSRRVAPELNESSGRCAWCNTNVESFHFICRSQLVVDCWIHHKGMYRSQAKMWSVFFCFCAFSLCIANIIPNKRLTLLNHENISNVVPSVGRKQTVNTLNKNIYSRIFCKVASLILLFLHLIWAWVLYFGYMNMILNTYWLKCTKAADIWYLQLKLVGIVLQKLK